MKNLYVTLVAFLVTTASFGQVTLVSDINPGTGNASPTNLFVHNGYIYFSADDAGASVDHGKELWRTNGTTVELIKDIRSGASNSIPSYFFEFSNTLYFSANAGAGTVLFSTDGTEVGTTDAGLATGLFFTKEYNGKVYFIKTTELNAFYEFDGNTVQRVANTSGKVENVLGGVYTFLNEKVLLNMRDNQEDKNNITGTEVGVELYEYDFSTNMYTLIKNIAEDDLTNPEPNSRIKNSGISNMVNLGTKVYFEAENVLWETDGTTVGTIAVAAASSLTGVSNFFVWESKLFFEGDNGTDGDELYVYDPSGNTVTKISNIDGTVNDHNPSDYCAYNGYLYYAGQDNNDTKKHLFRTNGTVVEQVDANIIDVDEIVELNGILYFEAEDATGSETTGNELFQFDPLTLDLATDAYISNLFIYPNPTEGVINIDGLISVDTEYTLFDISGRIVTTGVVLGQSIDLNVKAGVYLLQLIDNGTKSVHKIQVK